MSTKKGKRLPKALTPALDAFQLALVESLNDPVARPQILELLCNQAASAVERGDAELAGGAFGMFAEAMRRGYELPPGILSMCGFALKQAMRAEDGRNAVVGTFGKKGNKRQPANRGRDIEIWLRFREARAAGVTYPAAVESLAAVFKKSPQAIRSIIDQRLTEERARNELIRVADRFIDAAKPVAS